jgi:PKD repeat protein
MPETSGVHTITVQAENVTPVDVVPLNNGISDDQVVVNIAPVAIAGGNRTGDWNAQIEFDGTASNDEDGQVENYLWDFGDGKTSGRSVTSHAYMLPGIYTATLMVTDNRGASSVDTFQVEIIDTRSDLIVSALLWSPVEPQERDLVTITAAITNIGNGPTQSGFFATFYIDGMYRGYQRVNEILDIGDDHQVFFEWTTTKGLHMLKIIADDIQDNIVERDENNNTSETPLTVTIPEDAPDNAGFVISLSAESHVRARRITITEPQLPWVERIWSGQDTLVPQGSTNMLIRFTPPDSITPDI